MPMLLIISRFLAIMFAIVNVLAIFPVGMLGFVLAFRISTTNLGIDQGVAIAMGCVGMILAVAIINGGAAVFVCILDRLSALTSHASPFTIGGGGAGAGRQTQSQNHTRVEPH
ncbi:MAG: hypothetical protein MJE68_16400 [Proteobacteria bacterium]|nr:hypothetical protein [Pseudomonadota bacterium]